MPERRLDPSRAELIAAASRRLLDNPRSLEPDQRHDATVLLADLYVTGLRHGIIDVIRLRDHIVDGALLGSELRPGRPRPTTSVRGLGRQR